MATPLFQIAQPLTSSDVSALKPALDNLQGNLLKSHGRDCVSHVFITFTGALESARNFMSGMSIHATSANEQQKQTERHNADRTRNELFTQVLISAQGYAFLNADTSGFADLSFRLGMKQARPKLNDPPIAAWEKPFQQDVHVMIVLAHDIREAVEDRADEIRDALKDVAEVHVEIGLAVKNEDDRVIEHFGYIDGRSQPLFFADDVQAESTVKWNPAAGPSLILVKDPLGKSDDDCGTYYVFRKLEQNVQGFKRHEQALADALHLTGDARELAGALVVGRFENGTPVVLHQAALEAAMGAGGTGGASTSAPPVENDFAYPADDAPGNKCPFIGHIRKTNPRGDSIKLGATLEAEKLHRIARRGITFGKPVGPGEDFSKMPTGGVGLLFQCCNSNLSQQFEFMQQSWANNLNFVVPGNGIDPVMGQSADGAFPTQHWPASYGSGSRVDFGFNNFVTMKGGEYFFCPSITFLKSLAAA